MQLFVIQSAGVDIDRSESPVQGGRHFRLRPQGGRQFFQQVGAQQWRARFKDDQQLRQVVPSAPRIADRRSNRRGR